jgi:hypothetical protein
MNRLSATPNNHKYCIADYLDLFDTFQLQTTSKHNLNTFFKQNVVIPKIAGDVAPGQSGVKTILSRCRILQSLDISEPLLYAPGTYQCIAAKLATSGRLRAFFVRSSLGSLAPSLQTCRDLHTLEVGRVGQDQALALARHVHWENITTLSIDPSSITQEVAERLGQALGRCACLQHLAFRDSFTNWLPSMLQAVLQPIQADTLVSFEFTEPYDAVPPDEEDEPRELLHFENTLPILGSFLQRCTSLQKFEYYREYGTGVDLMPLFQTMPWTIPSILFQHDCSAEELAFLRARPWQKHQIIILQNCDLRAYPQCVEFISDLFNRCHFKLQYGRVGTMAAHNLLRSIPWTELNLNHNLANELGMEILDPSPDPDMGIGEISHDDYWRALSVFVREYNMRNLCINPSAVKTLDFSYDKKYSLHHLTNIILPLVKQCPALTFIDLSGTRMTPEDLQLLQRTIGNRPIRIAYNHCPFLRLPAAPAAPASTAAAAAPVSKKRPLDPVPPQADGAPPPPKKPHTDPD